MEKLLPELRKQDRFAQKELFDRLSAKMLSVCRSYVTDSHHAEDCMLRGFMKVFKKMEAFNEKGSFEGWVRRIMVNECLDFLRAYKSLVYLDDSKIEQDSDEESDMTGIDAQELLDQLPENYRTVFNLFVLEDYSHKEIAEILSISEATSKTQLSRAKAKIREMILEKRKMANEK